MTEQSTELTEQPSQDSTTQDDQVNGQEEVTSSESSETDKSGKTDEYDLDGEKITAAQIKEWKQGYMRQDDYTRKTQELAKAKEPQKEELPEDVKLAIDTLRKAGVVTKEDLALQKAQEEDERSFKDLLKKHPELKTHEKALSQIGRVDHRPWDELASDYGFITKDKLAKAKDSKPIVGEKIMTPPKAKSVADMSPAEWEAYKKQNSTGGLK